jgi:hypothetical protein
MTRLTINDEKGRHGVAYVRNIIENGWRAIMQDFEGVNDRGLDATISDVHQGKLTALRFDVQIKTSNFSKYKGDSFPAPLDQSHLDLFRNSNMPVVLICVDEGPPPRAYWKLVEPNGGQGPIIMKKKQLFGPASRDAIVSAIRQFFPKRIAPAQGDVPEIPPELCLRKFAKDYYYRNLMNRPIENRNLGPIEFTWKGWRHITRRLRSRWKIQSSFLLLPCLRPLFEGSVFPIHWRPLATIRRGDWEEFRTLLTHERVVVFRHRSPAWLRVVIEAKVVVPANLASCPPYDPRRRLSYKFLSLSELPKPVDARDMSAAVV